MNLNVGDDDAEKGEFGERKSLSEKSARALDWIVCDFDFELVFRETLAHQLGVLVHSVSVTSRRTNGELENVQSAEFLIGREVRLSVCLVARVKKAEQRGAG